MVRLASLAACMLAGAWSAVASAEPVPDTVAPEVVVISPKRIAGFRVHGKTIVTETTVGYLAHVQVGDTITTENLPELEKAMMSSELFEVVKITLEDSPDGVLVVAELKDKLRQIAAPTVYISPGTWSVGVGYVNNDLRGEDKKLLLYGQLGNRTNLFYGAYLDPSVNGTKLTLRLDIFTYQMIRPEYANPVDDPTNFSVARYATETFLDAGALVGWQFKWWLSADVRLRGAYVYFRNAHADDVDNTALPRPEVDGWDNTLQFRVTIDHRTHLYGVTSGAYAQAFAESSLPWLDTYQYQDTWVRAYYSWKFFQEHELELRGFAGVGRHMPFHEELTNGGESDLRGYDADQFRGDTQLTGRAEYSVPLFKITLPKIHTLAFRANAFWDTGYVKFNFPDRSGMRQYLPGELDGNYWFRNDVGVGFRVYLRSVVIPLLGVDLGYGIEGHSPEVYFALGLTDF